MADLSALQHILHQVPLGIHFGIEKLHSDMNSIVHVLQWRGVTYNKEHQRTKKSVLLIRCPLGLLGPILSFEYSNTCSVLDSKLDKVVVVVILT